MAAREEGERVVGAGPRRALKRIAEVFATDRMAHMIRGRWVLVMSPGADIRKAAYRARKLAGHRPWAVLHPRPGMEIEDWWVSMPLRTWLAATTSLGDLTEETVEAG